MGYANKKNFSGRATSNGADAQIITAPWRIRSRYIPKKIIATNEGGTPSIVKIYDKDASAGAPTARGDATNNPLIEFYIPANSTVFIEEAKLVGEFFQGGITVNCTVTPVQFNIEVEQD